MRFGDVPLADAQGAILAHSLRQGDLRLRKGRVLSAEDLSALQAAGVDQVTVARLDPGDLGEDLAAERIARALVPDPERAGLRLGRAATGRVNITASAPGIVEVLEDRIHGLNALDPMVTVATVPPWQRVDAGGMVATVKIISYAVSEVAVEAACLAGQAALRLRRPVCRSALLIQTVVDSAESGEKGQQVTRERLSRLGVDLLPKALVPHQSAALSDALRGAQADVILILTGSATSDPADVAPQALQQAGGRLIHYGMPVDPGNLLFFGELSGRPVIGLPGCARSPAMNGADWVLERLICGVPVTPTDIARMGVGGLLKEIPIRGRLRQA